MAFESQKGSGDIWNPTKDEEGDPRTTATPEDFMDGHYIGKKENQGEHKSTIYTIQKQNGEKVNVWGTKVLNDQMDGIRRGVYCRIQWLGKKLTKAGEQKKEKQRTSQDSFHDWEVFVDNDVKPLDVNLSEGDKNFGPGASSKQTTSSTQKPDISQEDDLPF